MASTSKVASGNGEVSRKADPSLGGRWGVGKRPTGGPAQGRPQIIAILALTCGILAGCGSSAPPDSAIDGDTLEDTITIAGDASPPADPATDGSGAAAGPGSSWITTVSYVGHGLRLSSGDVDIMQIGCVRESREMTVDVPGFTSIGSEERLSVGIDDEPYIFVAQVTPPPPAGVHATRPIEEDVLTALQGARSISAFYGTQSSGPHAAPDSAMLQSFLSGCRQASAP